MGILMRNHGKFTKADLLVNGVVCTAGQFNKLGQYIVKAGEAIKIGFGPYDSFENATGRIYAILKNAANVEIPGEWSLNIESPLDTHLATLGTWRSEDWNTVANDKTKQIPFPEMPIGASKDKKFVLYFKPDATDTVSLANSVMNMDITRILL